ncbi:MAG TPA: hypothetical protein PLD25_14260 [Chloroflexota bacterium]|nr:hypothetical protein [Chloroflexota bacterium]HUM70309.1 hypothetical protein [Chloroflexota bacterium]
MTIRQTAVFVPDIAGCLYADVASNKQPGHFSSAGDAVMLIHHRRVDKWLVWVSQNFFVLEFAIK